MTDERHFVSTWQFLIEFNYHHAAAGLLRDLFDCLIGTESLPEVVGAPLPKRLQDFMENHSVTYREQAMTILGDNDGTTLFEWIRIYEDDRREFLRLAVQLAKQGGAHSVAYSNKGEQ